MDSSNRVKGGEFSDVYIERPYIVMCYQMYRSGVEHRRVFVVTSDMGLLMGGVYIQVGFVLPACITNKKTVDINIL
jgi:hypothetical protein